VKGDANVRLGKTGSDGMPGKLAPSSSYFFDTPERKEITRISGNPFRVYGVSSRIPFDFAQGKFTGVLLFKIAGILDQQNKRDREDSTDLFMKRKWRPQR
jgi:hypothetical protein